MPRRLQWQVAEVRDLIEETPRVRSLVLDLPDWPGHKPGQHVDVRLTGEDGYRAQRSYSIASAPEANNVILTVERIEDGEVSPYLSIDVQQGRPVRIARADRRAFRLDRGAGRPALPDRGRLRHRAADGDAAPPRGGKKQGAGDAAFIPRAASRTSSIARSSTASPPPMTG